MPIEEEGEQDHVFHVVQEPDTEDFVESTNVHEIDVSRVAGVCYWSPEGKAVTPIKVGQVNECNNFKDRQRP